jgi:chloramphenicol-sensitive protein RarD
MHQQAPPIDAAHRRARQGVVYGVLSYGLWGLIPLYFKWVANVAAIEVLAQRVVWSFVLLAAMVTALGRWEELRAALVTPKVLLALSASTLLLALNWFTYIYAVSTNQVVEASLGYFLNPLVNVVLGVAILKERLRPWQMVSLLLAGAGVAILGAPLIAVTLAVSFAFYALLRKTVAVDGLLGLTIETLLVAPLALAYIAWLESVGRSAFVLDDKLTCLKLAASGVVTAAPLLLFTAAARRLQFSTLGFLQYLAPTVQFILAVALFGEALSDEKVAALACIWTAVAIYSVDSLRHYRAQRSAIKAIEPVAADL